MPVATFLLQNCIHIVATDRDLSVAGFIRNLRRKIAEITSFVVRLLCIFWGGLFALSVTSATAETYFVDPATTGQQLGTAQAPRASLDTALASGEIQGGDVIALAAGRYGVLDLTAGQFEQTVMIQGPEIGIAHFEYIYLRNVHNLTLDRIAVWPTVSVDRRHLVRADPNTSHIVLRNMDIRSTEDAAGYPNWDLSDWERLKYSGILLRGPDSHAQNNTLTGLYLALSVFGSDAVVTNNTISGFSADGIRALGDRSVIAGNLIHDCVQIDSNHADGFQSWSLGPDSVPGTGIVTGLNIHSNIILEWTSEARPDFSCHLQGIGMFDGMFRDTVIENNIISVTSYHGITIAGGLNSQIVHNTVVNASDPTANWPWISFRNHKDGRPSEGALVANNIVPVLQLDAIASATLEASQNLTGPYLGRHLEAPFQGNYLPVPGGAAHDTGTLDHKVGTDIFGTSRPQGEAPDIGAIERP